MDDDDVKALLREAHQLMMAGAQQTAFGVLVQAVERLSARLDLYSALLVSTSPEAAMAVRLAAGLAGEGKA